MHVTMTHRFAPAVTPPSPFPKGLSHPSHRGPVGTAADVASSLRGDSGLAAEGGVRGRSGSRSEGFGTRRPNSQLQHPPIAPFERPRSQGHHLACAAPPPTRRRR